MIEQENQAVVERMVDLTAKGDLRAAMELYHVDAVVEWPQSGERVVGRDRLLEVLSNYPGGVPAATIRRIRVAGDLVIGEYIATYPDGTSWYGVGIFESRDGKIAHETDYFGQRFPAPEWRARWVESTEDPSGRETSNREHLVREVSIMAKWRLSPGDWCHVEFLAADMERARRFYGEVFGWQFVDYPGVSDYVGVRTSEDGIEGAIGGLAQLTGRSEPATSGLVAYIEAPDMDATIAAIERAGGEIVIPKTDALGYGDFAHFRDLDGNLIGLWRDAPSEVLHASGDDRGSV